MDPGQLSESGLMISTAGVLTPVSEVLTISVDKDPGGVEPVQQSVPSVPQAGILVGEPETKLQEETVTSIPGITGAREELAQMIRGSSNVIESEKSSKSYETETSNKPGDIEKTMTLHDSQNGAPDENAQHIFVRVKASEPVELIKKLVADTIRVPLSKAGVYYRGIQVRNATCFIVDCSNCL